MRSKVHKKDPLNPSSGWTSKEVKQYERREREENKLAGERLLSGSKSKGSSPTAKPRGGSPTAKPSGGSPNDKPHHHQYHYLKQTGKYKLHFGTTKRPLS